MKAREIAPFVLEQQSDLRKPVFEGECVRTVAVS